MEPVLGNAPKFNPHQGLVLLLNETGDWCSKQDLNLYKKFRKLLCYPLHHKSKRTRLFKPLPQHTGQDVGVAKWRLCQNSNLELQVRSLL